jgi:hypothetical protein
VAWDAAAVDVEVVGERLAKNDVFYGDASLVVDECSEACEDLIL